MVRTRAITKAHYGMLGSMKFYDQKYNGALTVSPWEIVMTKRFDGKTSTFWAQYEAVRGGRVLHLTDKTIYGHRSFIWVANERQSRMKKIYSATGILFPLCL
jgi:hypothetical protein